MFVKFIDLFSGGGRWAKAMVFRRHTGSAREICALENVVLAFKRESLLRLMGRLRQGFA